MRVPTVVEMRGCVRWNSISIRVKSSTIPRWSDCSDFSKSPQSQAYYTIIKRSLVHFEAAAPICPTCWQFSARGIVALAITVTALSVWSRVKAGSCKCLQVFSISRSENRRWNNQSFHRRAKETWDSEHLGKKSHIWHIFAVVSINKLEEDFYLNFFQTNINGRKGCFRAARLVDKQQLYLITWCVAPDWGHSVSPALWACPLTSRKSADSRWTFNSKWKTEGISNFSKRSACSRLLYCSSELELDFHRFRSKNS